MKLLTGFTNASEWKPLLMLKSHLQRPHLIFKGIYKFPFSFLRYILFLKNKVFY